MVDLRRILPWLLSLLIAGQTLLYPTWASAEPVSLPIYDEAGRGGQQSALVVGEGIAGPPSSTEQAIRLADVPWRDLTDLAVRAKGVSREAAQRATVAPSAERQVGHRATFWVADEANDRYHAVSATLEVVGPHTYMYVADGARVDQADLREAARVFEERIYQPNRAHFGPEPLVGIDGDPRVTVLHANIPGLGGYFTSVDDYPRSVQPYSNERKMLYVNIDALPPGSDGYYGVLAHEFQHMVHWRANKLEQTWVKEGAAEVATEAANLGGSAAARAFEARSDTQLNAWADIKGDVAPHYGASYLFLSYFLERFGGYRVAADLLAGDTRGPETFDRFLADHGYGISFESVFRDWVVANYLDEDGVRDRRYRYDRLEVRVPPTERVTSSTGWRDRTVHQFAADYVEVGGRWSRATIRFQGVQETRVVPAEARSGRYFWWSNRGDMVDTRLTRIFDLRDVPSATLRFSTWYDLEEGYDYAYLMVSRDGGLTWTTLATSDTTMENPNGNNLGNGFTGKSGGGKSARWIEQTVDLTPFVGDVILIRFELVTDDAYNAPGFALDDISLPELGYRSDAEDDGGWLPVGFVRTHGELSQLYSLQLIRFGDEITVGQVPLSPSRDAEVVVENPDGRLEKVVLVVSGLTRHTTEPAPYRYAVELTP